MSVRRRLDRDPATGAEYETWLVDVRWVHPDGRRQRIKVRSPVNTRRGAEEYERQVRVALLAGTWGRKEAPTVTAFAPDFLAWCRAQMHKPSSVAAKASILEHHLVPALGRRKLDELTGADVLAVQRRLLEPAEGAAASAKTVNNVLSVLSKMLKVAVKLDLIRHVPVQIELVRAPPPPMEHLEEEELDELLAGARKHDPRTVLVVLLGADAGLRVGEMVGLEWTDVDFRRRSIHVQRSVWDGAAEGEEPRVQVVAAPKGGRSRRVAMTSRLAEALQATRHLRGPRVLWRDDGEPVTTRVLEGRVAAAARAAGLAVSGCHVLRHTFCSRLAARGAAPVAIMKAAGHSSLHAVQRYLHLAPAHVDRAIALLEPAQTSAETAEGPEAGPRNEKAP